MANHTDSKWYDLANIDELHQDLRSNYAGVRAVIAERPLLSAHFRNCEDCREIRILNETSPMPTPGPRTRRMKKLILTYADLAALLGLPGDVDIAHVQVNPDPLSVAVVLHSPRYYEVPVDRELPVVTIEVA